MTKFTERLTDIAELREICIGELQEVRRRAAAAVRRPATAARTTQHEKERAL